MAKRWKPKDPDDVADYVISWATNRSGGPGRTYGDPITVSSWTVPTGLVKEDEEFTSGTTTVWLSGGSAGTTYKIVNHVTTQGGREFDQTVELPVETR